MKVLFFFLALANVAVFMWEYHQGAFSVPQQTLEGTDSDYPEQIVLLSELNSNSKIAGEINKSATIAKSDSVGKDEIEEKPSTPESLADNLTAVSKPVLDAPVLEATPNNSEKTPDKQKNESAVIACYEAGPFANNTVYQIWEKRLSGYIKPVDRDEQIVSDYLVYFPASGTLIESKANMQMLKEKGINDLYMISNGEEQGLISLGVYRREERALIMKNELLAKGINAEVKSRYKNKVQKFAFIKGESAALVHLESLKKAYPAVTVREAVGPSADSCF
jgi:hypothetical protein